MMDRARQIIDTIGRAQTVLSLVGVGTLSVVVTAVVHGLVKLSTGWLVLLGVSVFVGLVVIVGLWGLSRGPRPFRIVRTNASYQARPNGGTDLKLSFYLTNPNTQQPMRVVRAEGSPLKTGLRRVCRVQTMGVMSGDLGGEQEMIPFSVDHGDTARCSAFGFAGDWSPPADYNKCLKMRLILTDQLGHRHQTRFSLDRSMVIRNGVRELA